MKKFKLSISFLAAFALLFTSCSKEEAVNTNSNPDMATLSFGALLTDLATNRAANKAHTSFLDGVPECSDEAAAYVEIVLSMDGNDIVGTQDEPYRVNLADGQIFTVEDANLELMPGNYSLDYFAVHGASGNMIWLAPWGNGNDLSSFVDQSLPMAIDLRAGVKKYVEVDVLCYDDRMVNQYGYLFFEIDQNEAIELCIFGNYCDESGRHYAAEYTVDVWSYSNGEKGDQMYNDVPSTVTMNDAGDYAGSPVCFALPDTDGMDEYYFEITLRNSDAYDDIQEHIVRAGVITDGDVRDLMDGDDNVDYYHFRAGNCGDMGDTPDLLEADIYSSWLSSLNDSGVWGHASLIQMDNKLTVKVWADGLTPSMVHPQHIHGLESDENGTCPPSPGETGFMAADTNGNGVIELGEGAPFYGPVLLSLYNPIDEFPVANADGELYYERTFTLGETEFEEEGAVPTWEELAPLVNRTIVLHGMNFEGNYIATLPVACGQIQWVYNAQ
ncbi:hypothetical protein LZ575_00935 [Antarcticibacterium sp. 1MA-6-2]|uniref:hypothetical protein n=1 Tax=Antarcticibacterium sp. 1MA-6-2 TaxID=2908210 RepID=UPI001F458D01|nr:hypothetical protein [Antarcticibacterium sp. 1MA-6-2]UJH91386.1 hypothetical protein LZ575_00935 [Antarcticibacterium sp. 1MA-6-2]